jgi:hypothetical protein
VVIPLVDLINARLEADRRIAEFEDQLKPLKEAKQEINRQIIEEFKRRGEFSTKVEGATVTLSVLKTAVVVDEAAVIQELKDTGLTQYISESLNELFDGPKKQIAAGEMPPPKGMVIQESEFISIRKNDKKEARKVVTSDFKKLSQHI